MHVISFPGLGIGEFEIDQVAFSPFGVDVAWYGIIIVLGMMVAVAICFLRAKESRLLFDDMIDITFATVFPGVIGARAYYVFFDALKNPGKYKDFFSVINIRGGGLAIYGGILFGALGCFIAMKVKKVNILKFFDYVAPAVMIAQAIGRWGNFFNAEAYGAETSLPWRMRLGTGAGAVEVHPTFFYESLWNLIGFSLILALLGGKKKKYDGQVTLAYFAWYGLGRMFIEGLRQDSLYIGPLRVSQWLAGFFLVSAVTLLIYFAVSKKRPPLAECVYKTGSKKYNKVMGIEEHTEEAENVNEENAENTADSGGPENDTDTDTDTENEKEEDTEK